jgi:DNA-binding NtrC family response regulator
MSLTENAQTKARLLAIDDNVDSAELVTRIAGKCGYETRFVTDTRTMQDILEVWRPDVVTLDLCMPDEDGIGILSALKGAGFEGALIIISGQDDWLRKTAGRLASARGLLVVDDMQKPVDLTALRELLTKLQRQRAA